MVNFMMKDAIVMDELTALAVAQSEPYRRLTRTRNRLQWLLAGVMLAAYYGFILVVAFSKQTLAIRLGDSVVTLAIPVGLAIVALAVITTALYVSAANRTFDALNQSITDRARQ